MADKSSFHTVHNIEPRVDFNYSTEYIDLVKSVKPVPFCERKARIVKLKKRLSIVKFMKEAVVNEILLTVQEKDMLVCEFRETYI